MEKDGKRVIELKLIELSNITFLMGSFRDKNIENQQVD